jgi:pimeloyl-ACP methyl ester carboxylesterase
LPGAASRRRRRRSASDAPSRRFGTIDFQPCTLSTEGASANVEAQCATLQVPEDRAQPDGRRIGLRIAWLESGSSGASQPDPVFFLAGGPGQAASEVAVIVDTALRQVRKQRDVFLIDQRGTGGSNPLSCLGADGKELQMDEDAAPSEASLRDYAQRCAASLQGRADARFYTTTEAIADLDAVRRRLAWTSSTWSAAPTAPAWPSAMRGLSAAHPQHRHRWRGAERAGGRRRLRDHVRGCDRPAVGAVPQGCRLQQAFPDRYPRSCAAWSRPCAVHRSRSSIAIPAPTHPAGCADAGQRGRPGLRLLLRAAVFLAAAAGAG